MFHKLCVAVAIVALFTVPAAWAAEPADGTVAKKQDAVWSGGPFTAPNPVGCAGSFDPTCDHFNLTVDASDGAHVAVAIATATPDSDDFDLFVYDAAGNLLASSATGSGNEQLVFQHTAGTGPYEVRVQPWLVNPGATYDGFATLTGDPVDVERDCLELVPESTSLDFTQPVSLDVMVLLDGPSKSRGNYVMQKAAESYAPANIHLKWKLKTVSYTTNDADALIQAAKDQFGGVRPAGYDLVYVMTTKDIQSGGNDGVAGLADCIGGVRFPEHAFAVGEDFGAETDAGRPLGPFVHTTEGTAVVAAHELGHLMGAHHHYGNCVEGFAASELQNACSEEPTIELTPCTLMFNFVNFASLPFSTVNKSVVRGHALDNALP